MPPPKSLPPPEEPENPEDGIVERYNADGTLDTGFASGGRYLFNLGSSYYARPTGVLIDELDGNRIVVWGHRYGQPSDGFVLRLTSDGVADDEFTGLVADATFSDCAVDPQTGNYVACGRKSNQWFLLARYPIPAGVTVTPTEGLVTTEELDTQGDNGTDTFVVWLNTQPTADVIIGLSSDDTSEGTVSPASLTFTSANWNQPQTVTVTGVDDDDDDGDVGYMIVTAAAVSVDTRFSGLDAADVSVTNSDDDGGSPPLGVTVGNIVPSTVDRGADSAPVTITGSGFQDGATVTFVNGKGQNPSAIVTSVTGTTIEATVTVPTKARFTSWDVRVMNPDGSVGVLENGLTVVNP